MRARERTIPDEPQNLENNRFEYLPQKNIPPFHHYVYKGSPYRTSRLENYLVEGIAAYIRYKNVCTAPPYYNNNIKIDMCAML